MAASGQEFANADFENLRQSLNQLITAAKGPTTTASRMGVRKSAGASKEVALQTVKDDLKKLQINALSPTLPHGYEFIPEAAIGPVRHLHSLLQKRLRSGDRDTTRHPFGKKEMAVVGEGEQAMTEAAAEDTPIGFEDHVETTSPPSVGSRARSVRVHNDRMAGERRLEDLIMPESNENQSDIEDEEEEGDLEMEDENDDELF
ncbi:hypothetical protein LTR85_004141 [Meristemomyces frigidus]|nr:hypothetical protein LTR85_004141 [Meristemomyces frigidus]